MRFLFVVNPNAGRVDETVLRARLEREFRGHDISIVSRVSSRRWLETAHPSPTVVAVGGDGTVQHVLREIGAPFPCPFGILPLGTANDLAQATGIPSDLGGACALLREGATRSLDLMEVNGIPFATCGGLGLPASVARRADRLRSGRLLGGALRRFGRCVYLLAALLELGRRWRPLIGRLDGAADGRGRSYAAILVSNQPIVGGFRPSPDADPGDGRLDLCAIEVPRWRPRMLWITLRTLRGDVALCREVRTARRRSITVTTEHPTPFLGDGEVLQRGTRFEIRVRPAALPLVCPAGRQTGARKPGHSPIPPGPVRRPEPRPRKEDVMNHRRRGQPKGLTRMMLAALALAIGVGCSDEMLTGPETGPDGRAVPVQIGDTPPPGLATVQLGTESLALWPYTGSSFDGTPVDPVNVIFAGEVHPLQIRAALMALDGDRSAFGIPPIPPFDARWTDVVGGGVQTAYSEGPLGWTGSVVQLTLGEFGPLRVHLRLFRTGQAYGDAGTWTVAGAHFEVQIPGTADHQVLSWELAEQIVMVDLIRTGLLDASLPMSPSGVISDTPSFRTIPEVIYNGLPDALIALIGGPAKPVTGDVPIASDGQATILNVAGAHPVEPGSWVQTSTATYDQIVPKPFCADGPGDYMHVIGPVDFETRVDVNANGDYTYHSSYTGALEAQPLDLSSGVPVPVGEPLVARVDGQQNGFLSEDNGRIAARDKRIALGGEGPELLVTRLVVPERGRKVYRVLEKCIDED